MVLDAGNESFWGCHNQDDDHKRCDIVSSCRSLVFRHQEIVIADDSGSLLDAVQLFCSCSEFVNEPQICSSYFPNLSVSQLVIDSKVFEADPVQSL